MITLTIDGRQVSVEPGTTVLEAARLLDIRIPTLCHVPGLEPASSCLGEWPLARSLPAPVQPGSTPVRRPISTGSMA